MERMTNNLNFGFWKKRGLLAPPMPESHVPITPVTSRGAICDPSTISNSMSQSQKVSRTLTTSKVRSNRTSAACRIAGLSSSHTKLNTCQALPHSTDFATNLCQVSKTPSSENLSSAASQIECTGSRIVAHGGGRAESIQHRLTFQLVDRSRSGSTCSFRRACRPHGTEFSVRAMP